MKNIRKTTAPVQRCGYFYNVLDFTPTMSLYLKTVIVKPLYWFWFSSNLTTISGFRIIVITMSTCGYFYVYDSYFRVFYEQLDFTVYFRNIRIWISFTIHVKLTKLIHYNKFGLKHIAWNVILAFCCNYVLMLHNISHQLHCNKLVHLFIRRKQSTVTKIHTFSEKLHLSKSVRNS